MDIIREVLESFKDKIDFKPIIYTFTSHDFEMEIKDCVSGGSYCSFPSSVDASGRGRVILLESLKESCIFEIYHEEVFFRYIEKFQKCSPQFSEICSINVMDSLLIDKKQVRKCVDLTFEKQEGDIYSGKNLKLEKHKEIQKEMSAKSFPVIFVNDMMYKGSLAYKDLYLTVCALINKESGDCAELPMEIKLDVSVTQIIIFMCMGFVVGLIILCYVCKFLAKRKYLRFS